MIDPGQLGSDMAAISVALLTAPLLWLFLFLWAWDRPAQAEAAGFGRRTFWLLLPGAALASLANAPFFGWDGSILAVNIGGGLIPILLSLLLLRHWEQGQPRSLLPGYLAAFGGLCVVLFALVLLPLGTHAGAAGPFGILYAASVQGGSANWTLLTAASAFPLGGAIVTGLTADPAARLRRLRVTGLLLLTSAALLATFFTSQAVPQVGILSQFPSYLYGPLAIGALSPLLARPLFRLPVGAGLAIGYASATLGVLMGADLLHQPPLYGGAPGLLSIGGAGIADLVYLSGLLAAAVSFVIAFALARKDPSAWGTVTTVRPTTPTALWREAVRLHAQQRFPEAIASAEAAVAKADQDHQRIWELPAVPPAVASWSVPSPPYVHVDRQNLAALARAGSNDPRDSSRALYAARSLIDHANRASQTRFASFGRRFLAFGIDVTVLSAPAIVVWYVLAELLYSGGANVVEFTAAIFAYIAYAFLYFVAYEIYRGTTLGKRAMGLEVRDRAHRTPGLLPALLRSTTKLPILFLLAVVLAGSTLLIVGVGQAALGSLGPLVSLFGITLLLTIASLPLLLIALVTWAAMHLSAERQRVGDLWAGTVVLERPRPGTIPLPITFVPSSVGQAPG
jgi:uncharacterized membrane protein/uncharacterized RDD family membrane protein YckC